MRWPPAKIGSGTYERLINHQQPLRMAYKETFFRTQDIRINTQASSCKEAWKHEKFGYNTIQRTCRYHPEIIETAGLVYWAVLKNQSFVLIIYSYRVNRRMPRRRTCLKSQNWFYANYEMGSVSTCSNQKWRSMIYLPSGNPYGWAAGRCCFSRSCC